MEQQAPAPGEEMVKSREKLMHQRSEQVILLNK